MLRRVAKLMREPAFRRAPLTVLGRGVTWTLNVALGRSPVFELVPGARLRVPSDLRFTSVTAYLLRDARQFRAELKMPLILLGGITNRETMDKAMAEGFDFVAMGRALLAEPDLLNRIQQDRTVRSLCTHCNQCMPTIYSHTHCVLTGAPDR